MTNYAYARVSAADQSLNRQYDCFLDNGIAKKNIYADKKSGKNFDRAAYRKLLCKLKKGDLLLIKSIDRLGRNYEMILDEWRNITKVIGADIFVLDMPLLDTRTQPGNLMGKLISDIVLQLLSFVAQNERENIKIRQAEGIAAAKRRGKRFGRRAIPTPSAFPEIVKRYQSGSIAIDEAMKLSEMKKSTFYNRMRVQLRDAATQSTTARTPPELSRTFTTV